MNRADMLQRLRTEPGPWDVLVIGGGATGLGAALDAAARGHRTVLVEQGDFAQGTSSRSTKLIHGGLRYLQRGDLALVRESLRERGRLLRNAPHLVHPVAFVIPHYASWHRPWYGLGLKCYDALAGPLGLEHSQHLSRDETLSQIRTLQPSGLRGGTRFFDGQFDDARLAITLAQTVADQNGVVINGVKVTTLLRSGARIDGVRARDVGTGEEMELRARVVVNATGVFADTVRRLDQAAAPDLLVVSQGAHVVLDQSFLPGGTALMVPRTDDGRVLFAIPWHGRVLVGTTDTPVSSAVLEPRPLRAEVEFLLNHVARYLVRAPTPSDVLSAFAGLRPLVKSGGGPSTSRLSRQHLIEVSRSGLVTITGGKWTTFRQMAEETIDRAAVVGGLPARPSVTRDLRLHGWCGNAEEPFSNFGSDAPAVRECCRSIADGDAPLHPRLPYRLGEVLWAVRHEMARSLEDVLSRRLRALPLDARASLEIAPRVARLVALELGCDAAWEQGEVSKFSALAQGCLVT